MNEGIKGRNGTQLYDSTDDATPFPFSKTVVLQIFIAVLVLLLALTMISLEDLFKRLLGILL